MSACFALIFAALMLAMPAAYAQPSVGGETAAAPARAADPYSGVVVDSTVTFVGQEFYRSFVARWREESGVERFSVTVLERPSARWGSLVWIEYAHREVFRAILSPGRRELVRTAGQDASGIVYQRVVDLEVQRLLFRDPDLAQDEL